MKKIASIVLCMLLMASTSGIAYAQHFCGDFEMRERLPVAANNGFTSARASRDRWDDWSDSRVFAAVDTL